MLFLNKIKKRKRNAKRKNSKTKRNIRSGRIMKALLYCIGELYEKRNLERY